MIIWLSKVGLHTAGILMLKTFKTVMFSQFSTLKSQPFWKKGYFFITIVGNFKIYKKYSHEHYSENFKKKFNINYL